MEFDLNMRYHAAQMYYQQLILRYENEPDMWSVRQTKTDIDIAMLKYGIVSDDLIVWFCTQVTYLIERFYADESRAYWADDDMEDQEGGIKV